MSEVANTISLPTIPLPTWLKKEIPASFPKMNMYAIPPDGNCFFRSVQLILGSIGINRSISDLRCVVANPVLDPRDENTNNTIGTWLELYQGAVKERNMVLVNEYQHMYPLQNAKLPLDKQSREILFANMLKSDYWGEEHACRIIEEQTQMRFLIISGDRKAPHLCWYHSKKFKPTHYTLLFLHGQHYCPISLNDRFIFEWKDIPHDVQVFFSKAYAK